MAQEAPCGLNLTTGEQIQGQTKGKGILVVERFSFVNADADLFCLHTCKLMVFA